MRSVLIELVILAGLLAAGFFLGCRPTTAEVTRLLSERESLQGSLAALQAKARQAPIARAETGSLRRLYEQGLLQERRHQDSTARRRALRAALSRAGAELLREGPALSSVSQAESAAPDPQAPPAPRIDEIVLSGRFLPILEAFQPLESEPTTPITIAEFEATRGERPSLTRVRVRLVTRTGSPERRPAAPEPAADGSSGGDWQASSPGGRP